MKFYKSRCARVCTIVLGFFVFTMSACSEDTNNAPKSGKSGSFKVALLTLGPTSDQSWNSGAYDGLMAIWDSFGAKVSHIQTKTPAEFDENFRQYGAQRYDLVFGHGFEFQDAVLRVVPEFPHTIYITTSGTGTAKNIAGMKFAFEEASYLAGMIAGAMTKTNMIGMIGGTELPPVKRSFAAFEQGARSVNPCVRTVVSYIGNRDDVSAGKEQAITQISRNINVIFQNANVAGLGVFQAIKESKDVRVIRSNSNQNNVASDVTIASVVIDLPRAFLEVAREIRTGKFIPRVISLGLYDNVVRLVLNPRMSAAIPERIRSEVDFAQTALINGTLKLPPVQ
jgi:basic membrane protein A